MKRELGRLTVCLGFRSGEETNARRGVNGLRSVANDTPKRLTVEFYEHCETVAPVVKLSQGLHANQLSTDARTWPVPIAAEGTSG